MTKKLTKRLIDACIPEDKEIVLWDAEVRGFFCRVFPSGRKSFGVYYRIHGGQQRRLTLGGYGQITVDMARGMALRALATVAEGGDPSGDRQEERGAIIFREYAKRYMSEYAQVHKKERSWREDDRHIDTVLIPRLGSKILAAINRLDIQRLHSSMADRPISANRILALLSKMFNLAEAWGYRPDGSNPCRHIRKYRETARKRFLDASELARLAKAINELEYENVISSEAANVFRLLILTGARLREIMLLRWEYVNLKEKRLELSDSKTGEKYIVLNGAACNLLQILKQDPSGWVFPGRRHGKPLNNIHRPWSIICKRACLEGLHIHDLRHSFGAIAAGLGMGLPVIGQLLGHRVAQTTHRYAHVGQSPAQQAAELVGLEIERMIEAGSKVVAVGD